METMIAYCGLDCGSCSIHLASLEQDKILQYEMRESIAKQLTNYYGIDSQPVDINNCDGCRAVNCNIFTGCLQCEIRKCAIEKDVQNCAFCFDYSCDSLRKHFEIDTAARTRLEKIRKTIE